MALANQIAGSQSPAPGSFPSESGVLSAGSGYERPMMQEMNQPTSPNNMPPNMMPGGFNQDPPRMGQGHTPSAFSGPSGPGQNQPPSLVSGVFGDDPAARMPPQPGAPYLQQGHTGGDPWNRGPTPPPAPPEKSMIFEGSSPNVARSSAPPAEPGANHPDPYLDHLANKVAGLRAQANEAVEEKPSPRKYPGYDSGWHDASVSIPPTTARQVLSTSHKMIKPPGLSFEIDKLEESATYIEDEQEYDRRNQAASGRSKKISRGSSARDAARKSEGMVSTVRAFKEYLIPAVMLVFLIVGGYQFMHENAAPTQAVKTNPGAIVTPPAPGTAGPISIFTSPDGVLQLSLSAGNKAVFSNGKEAMEAPYVVYDGSWSTVAMQAIDSLMECQFWFSEVRDAMQTENGTILYSQKSPDWGVLQKAKACFENAKVWWKTRQQYPAQPKMVTSNTAFIYTNPFTGQTKPIPIQAVNDNVNLKETFKMGGSLPGEQPFERGEIRAYAVRATADNQTGAGTAFFVRAANRDGDLFSSSDPGEKIFFGEIKGKDESNISRAITARQVYRPEKPTKVWIARNQQLPIFILYHSVPIVVGVIAFFLYWRSTMVVPGQTMDNSTNKAFRIMSMIGIFVTFCSGAIQFWLWK